MAYQNIADGCWQDEGDGVPLTNKAFLIANVIILFFLIIVLLSIPIILAIILILLTVVPCGCLIKEEKDAKASITHNDNEIAKIQKQLSDKKLEIEELKQRIQSTLKELSDTERQMLTDYGVITSSQS